MTMVDRKMIVPALTMQLLMRILQWTSGWISPWYVVVVSELHDERRGSRRTFSFGLPVMMCRRMMMKR